MGFWDSLKGFAELGIVQVKDNALFKQAIEKQDLTLLKKSITHQNMISYKNCNLTFYNFNLSDAEQAKKLFNVEDKKEYLDKTGERHVLTFDDVFERDVELAHQRPKEKKILKYFKPFLSAEDLSALISSLTIVRLEREERHSEAEKMYKELRESFTRRGRAIYNWVESGDFEDIIYPKLLSLIEEGKKKGHGEYSPWLHGSFKVFYEKKMEYFEKSIYVHAGVPIDDIDTMITKRLVRDKKHILYIYTRTERGIKNVKSAIEVFFKDNEEFELVDEEEGEIRRKPSKCFIIGKKDTKKRKKVKKAA